MQGNLQRRQFTIIQNTDIANWPTSLSPPLRMRFKNWHPFQFLNFEFVLKPCILHSFNTNIVSFYTASILGRCWH